MAQKRRFVLMFVGIALLLVGAAFAVRAGKVVGISSQLHQLAVETHIHGVPTKTFGCLARGGMPDPACTPGMIFPNVTREEICASGYSKKMRNVSQGLKDRIYAAYGIASHVTGEYQVDHHISLELGGSNEFGNLWPEAAEPKPGFHEKDEVENFLHTKLCEGEISVKDAQILISWRWKDVYLLLHDFDKL